MVEPLKIKHHSLTGRINLKLMHQAFGAVKRNKGKAGVDKVSIEMYGKQLEQNLVALMRDLKRGTYQPRPVRRTYIDKGGGKTRPLGLTNVVADGKILNLVQKFLTAGVLENGVVQSTTLGTPQGGVLSPLLANIALNFLDWHLDELGYRFVRYADDFVVLCRTEYQAKKAHQAIELFLEQLGLTLSPEKTRLTTFRKGFSFVGLDITSNSVKMRDKSVEKYKNRIRELTVRNHNLDSKQVERINAVVRGVARYFGTSFSTCVNQFLILDCWLRMRLRCMRKKRKFRTDNCRIKIKHLRRRGCVFLTDYLEHT